MNKLTLILLLALTATMTQLATAMNYISTNDDCILVFHKTSYRDVEFNLGSVSNFLNRPVGTSFPVSYSTNVCYTNFGNSISGVSFSVIATTESTATIPSSDAPGRVWLTSADVSAPLTWGNSQLNTVRNKIKTVGDNGSSATSYNASPYVGVATDAASYSQIVSDGVSANISIFGNLLFTVDAVNGSAIKLYEFLPSAATPKPAAKYVGTFTYATDGTVTFSVPSAAATLIPATITAITAGGGGSKIYFTSTNNNNYRLLYTTSLPGGWQTNVAAGLVAGNNGVTNFTDATTDSARYYRILSVP